MNTAEDLRRLPSYLLRLEGLDQVPLLDVLEALEPDSALESRLHLAHVVLEAPQGPDGRLVYDRAVSHEPRLRIATDRPVEDHAPRDQAQARHAERRAHLGLPQRNLLELRSEQPPRRVLDVLNGLVDDPVSADVDACLLREPARMSVGNDAETDHDGVRCLRERDVVLGDGPHAFAEHVHLDEGLVELGELAVERLNRPLSVRLDQQVELGYLALARGREELHQRRATRRDQVGGAAVLLSLAGDGARLSLVVQ